MRRLLQSASNHYGDVYGNPIEPDPARSMVRLDRGGAADVIVEYAPSDDPARDAAVRSAIEHSRLAIEIARLDADLNRQLAELDRSRRGACASAAQQARPRRQRRCPRRLNLSPGKVISLLRPWRPELRSTIDLFRGRRSGREGLTNQVIARHLPVAPRTAEAHVENIRRKLEAHSRAQIAGWVTSHWLHR
jgi:DNA-binding response OmpR family regulator